MDLQPNQQINMTLGIDAFSFRSFAMRGMTKMKDEKSVIDEGECKTSTHKIKNDDEDYMDELKEIFDDNSISYSNENVIFNHGFIFLGISLDYKYPPKILHIYTKENGCYDKSIRSRAKILQKIM